MAGKKVRIEGLMPDRCYRCGALVWAESESRRAQEAIAPRGWKGSSGVLLRGGGSLRDAGARGLVKPGLLASADSARVPWALSLLDARRPDGASALEPALVEEIAMAVELLSQAGRTRLAAAEM